jgi:hypothetical protein
MCIDNQMDMRKFALRNETQAASNTEATSSFSPSPLEDKVADTCVSVYVNRIGPFIFISILICVHCTENRDAMDAEGCFTVSRSEGKRRAR